MSEPTEISLITFLPDGLIQIQYSEERDYSEAAAIMKSIVVDTKFLDGESEQLLDVAREIVDKGLLLIRNPPKTRREREDEDD